MSLSQEDNEILPLKLVGSWIGYRVLKNIKRKKLNNILIRPF